MLTYVQESASQLILLSSTWIGAGGNVTRSLLEDCVASLTELSKETKEQKSWSRLCVDLCKDHDHNRVAERMMIPCRCSHVVRAKANV